MSKAFFTVGPSALFDTFENHCNSFIKSQLGSVSHRSQAFRDVYKHTDEQLRKLMNIPDSHGIFFTGSASEIWERILLNLVNEQSFHLVNGSFSKKFYDYAKALGINAQCLEKPLGQGFELSEINVPSGTELIGTTHNETSTGVKFAEEKISALKMVNPSSLIAVDMVSSAPFARLNYELVDTAFFSVQKAFGMPAGLGVWIASRKCLEIADAKKHVGAHNTLKAFWKNYESFETPATPNVMGIYILGKIAEEFNQIGMDDLLRKTQKRAAMLYDFFEKHPKFSVAVENVGDRSDTVVVANCIEGSKSVIDHCKKFDLVVGSGYGPLKEQQIRIANFPAVTDAHVEKLMEVLR